MTSERTVARPKEYPFRIQVLDRQRRFKIDGGAVTVLCAGVLRTLQQPCCALTVVFVGPDRIRAMNRDYRGRDYATDVLSFRYDGEMDDDAPFLGELILAPEVASSHARCWRTTTEREIRKLLIHGILHLLGYDHERDQGEMERLQARLVRRRGTAGSRIVRRRLNR